MSSILTLGRTVNLGRNASGGSSRVCLRDVAGVLCIVDTPANSSVLTLTEATATSGGTSQNLASGVTTYFTQTTGVWTRVTQAAGNTITVSGTPDLLAVYIPQGQLADGFAYLLASHSAKVTNYITGDLDVQRKPENLRNVYA